MSVAGEVEVAVGAEDGEHLVARCVDGESDVLHAAHAVVGERDAPDVEAALSAGHVAGEVEPTSVGRDGGMGEAGECVLADLQELGLAPGGVAAGAGVNLCVAGIVGVEGADGEVHRLSVGREAAGAFLVLAVEVTLGGFGLFPLAFVVLAGEEDVGALGARDAAYLVAFSVVAGGGEVEHVAVVAQECGREVAAPTGEDGLLLDAVERELFLPLRSHRASL